ncbi:class I SAM-dependent methyltransferase [Cryomorphaceae bacterium 1068]|nr:class I SAM-dependent methyltransferase [Cryomorphaceae bacterium 1068]
MSQTLLTTCPICRSDKLSEKETIVDHSISHESFQLYQCGACKFLFTNPQPDKESLWKYYESEDYVSHSRTTKGFINFWYRRVQQLNLHLKYKAVFPNAPRGTWLDYGAGAGDFVKYIENKGLAIEGLEPSQTARDNALSNSVKLHDTSYVHEVINESIACITLWHVLEHIPNFMEVIQDLSKLIIPRGILVLALPNYQSLDAKIYKTRWAGYDVPRHLWHFTKTDIENLAESFDLELINTKGMIFDSTYVSLLSEKYQNGNRLSGILNGMKSNVSAMRKSTPYSSQIYILRKKGV